MNDNFLNLYEFRKSISETVLLYNDVLFYSINIKGTNIEIITKEKYYELKTKYLEMWNIIVVNNFNYSSINIHEYRELIHNITIQIIIHNKEYLEKIIDIEKNITNFELNEEMTKLKNNILLHEKLNGIIDFDGFEITKIKF